METDDYTFSDWNDSQSLVKEFISLYIGDDVGEVTDIEFLPNAIADKNKIDQII